MPRMAFGWLVLLALLSAALCWVAPVTGILLFGYEGLAFAFSCVPVLFLGFFSANANFGLSSGQKVGLALACLVGASWGLPAGLAFWQIEPSTSTLCAYDALILTCFALGLKVGEWVSDQLDASRSLWP